jgi:hypothetical protein
MFLLYCITITNHYLPFYGGLCTNLKKTAAYTKTFSPNVIFVEPNELNAGTTMPLYFSRTVLLQALRYA